MRRGWRRYWPVLALAAAALAIVIAHLVIEWLTRERPNYTQIEDGLYLGGHVAKPPPGTQAVLNLCEFEDPYKATVHEWRPIRDAEPAPSIEWLRAQVEFIDVQRRAGRIVYVHCLNGASRSGMVLVAYEMHRNGWTRDRALAYVRSHRDVVRPNRAFMQLLLEWEEVIKKSEDNSRSLAIQLPGQRLATSGLLKPPQFRRISSEDLLAVCRGEEVHLLADQIQLLRE